MRALASQIDHEGHQGLQGGPVLYKNWNIPVGHECNAGRKNLRLQSRRCQTALFCLWEMRPSHRPVYNAPKFSYRIIVLELLNFAFNAGLRRELNKDIGSHEDVSMQFCFTRAVASNCIDMDTGANHVIGQYSRALFVGSTGRDDIRITYGIFSGVADHHI